jgi:hypothetical protein
MGAAPQGHRQNNTGASRIRRSRAEQAASTESISAMEEYEFRTRQSVAIRNDGKRKRRPQAAFRSRAAVTAAVGTGNRGPAGAVNGGRGLKSQLFGHQ